MNQLKVLRFMEIFWLVIAGVMAVFSGYMISTGNWDQAKVPLFGTFCAAILYGLRRYQRRKIQFGNKAPQTNDDAKKK